MWDELTLSDKARMIALAVRSGISDLRTIQEVYNTYAQGGDLLEEDNIYAKGGKIHIKPENRGKFTALKERTGHSASWFKEHGTPAQKKMATFALNARKWHHADGGPLSFEEWYKTVPKEKNDTTNYNLRRAYELAPKEDLDAFVNSDEHLYSAYENPKTGEYEFMKSAAHPSLLWELAAYNSDRDFNREYGIVPNGMYLKYVPYADGGPIDDGYTKKYIRRPGQGDVRTYDQRHLVQDVPQPEYNIFEDKSSFGRRDAHLKSLDNFITNNPTINGINTSDFRDVLSAFAGLESSYKSNASNPSGYSGYYGLKGGKDLDENTQHRKAYEHLSDMFIHNITKDDVQKGIDMGYTPAQILYKYWNQRNNATEFLQNGTAETIGNNPELNLMGNNIKTNVDYLNYLPDAVTDDYHIVRPGDTFSKIQEKVRKPGRHYNRAGKDLADFNTDDIMAGKLHVGDTVWFTQPYSTLTKKK